MICQELQKKATQELNEDPSRIKSDLKKIKEWARTQEHLSIRTDDRWLLSIIRRCKFDLELVKKKLDRICTAKTLLPEFYKNRDPFLPEIQEILKLGIFLVLPKLADPAAPRVFLLRAKLMNPKLTVENMVKVGLMMLEILLNEDENFVIAGGYFIGDIEGANINYLLDSFEVATKIKKCCDEAYVVRPKGIFCINSISFLESMFHMYKSQLESEYVEMVRIYNSENVEELYQHVPLSVLPEEYGGEGGTVQEITDCWKKKVESYKEWFLEDAKYCSNEDKRPGKALSSEEVFDTYKKVNVRELD